MVRVAKNIGPPDGPLKSPEPRIYLPLNNETIAMVKSDYVCLQEGSDAELLQALEDVQTMNN